MKETVWLIEVGSAMTQSAYFVDSISGKDLYSLSPNDAMQFDNKLDAMIKAGTLDTKNIIHHAVEHIFED